MNSTLYNAHIVRDTIFTEVIKDKLINGQVLYVTFGDSDYQLDAIVEANIATLENFVKCSNIHSFTPLHFDYLKCADLEGYPRLVASLTNGACLMAEIDEDNPNAFMAILHHFVHHLAEVNEACIKDSPLAASISQQIVLSNKDYTDFISLFACGTAHEWEELEQQHIATYLSRIDRTISRQINLYLIQHDIAVFQGCGESSYTSAGRCVTVTIESPEAKHTMKMPASIVNIWKKINECTDPTRKSELLEKMVEKSKDICEEMTTQATASVKNTINHYILLDDTMERNRSVDKVFSKIKQLITAAHQPDTLNDIVDELFRLMNEKKIKDPQYYDPSRKSRPYKDVIYGKTFANLLNERYPDSKLDPAKFDVLMRKKLCERAENKHKR